MLKKPPRARLQLNLAAADCKDEESKTGMEPTKKFGMMINVPSFKENQNAITDEVVEGIISPVSGASPLSKSRKLDLEDFS